MQLPKAKRKLVFYSEGKNYWPHLGEVIERMIEQKDISICFISSSLDDPGLSLKAQNYHSYYIGDGFVRDWFFQNIETEIMVMTMPDLNQYQVKRSRYPVHYIYVQHSLVSLHMIYRKGAFDHYDTICCAGPHHIKEVRALEKQYELPPKNIIKHGYLRLDSIIEEAKKHQPSQENRHLIHVLIAPSWGEKGLIESGLADSMISDLLENGFQVTFRPHPQTIKFAKVLVKKIVKQYQSNPLFNFENSVAGQKSLHSSDIMISDWSGVALEYAFGLKKTVIFCDIPKKIHNSEYQKINIMPFEEKIRDEIGVIWDLKEPISNLVKTLMVKPNKLDSLDIEEYIYNIKNSTEILVNYIYIMLKCTKSTHEAL